MNSDWRFADPQDTVVVTLERILRGDSSLVLVTHDAEDGGWQFLDGEHVFEEDGAIVLLGEMVQFDPSLLELADLPAGWCAWREAPDRPWQRALVVLHNSGWVLAIYASQKKMVTLGD